MQTQSAAGGQPGALAKWPQIVLLVIVAIVALGGVSSQVHADSSYNPHLFAIGTAGLLAVACAVLGILALRRRALCDRLRELETRNATLTKDNDALADAVESTNRFLESHGDCIVRRDRNGRIAYVNDAYCMLAGLTREKLLGSDRALDVLEQGDFAVLSDGTRIHDQKIATAAGPRWIAWRDVALHSEHAPTEIQSAGRDVTDRVNAEDALAEARDRAQDASRAKSRFLATVSHEIRTPLNGILGMSDLLLETRLTPEQATYTHAVKKSGETLLALIGEILDFSKIEAGRIDLDARPFRLAPLIEETIELLAPRAQAKGLEIATYIDPDLPARVTGDAMRVRQVLLNLTGNAIKFTDKGGVSITIEPGIWPDEIAFTVRDTGAGIAPAEQKRIFGEFEQGDAAAKAGSGSGLGLAISRRLVEGMTGRIGVESAPGEGATFEFTLPLPGESTPRPETPDFSGRTILIVSPGAVEAPIMARHLTDWGAHVAVVPDVHAAAAILPERIWDTLIADHALGEAALAALLRLTGDIARRIVLLTPSARGDLQRLRDEGFTGYLIKPVRTVSLAARLAAEPAREGAPMLADIEETSIVPDIEGMDHGLSILVAEDNEINALLTRAHLTKLGHRPSLAGDGAAACDAYLAAHESGAPYDLVLMDVRMPELDGLEAVRRIRAHEARVGAPHTPVIALTANAFPEDREACLSAGMDNVLIKPLSREKLADMIATVERRAQAAA
jgi:PAS domain S-box-containing protein